MNEPSMGASTLTELGRRLREERGKRGLSLQQVSERIHVAARYLEAIERGDEAGIPAPVYLRGFVSGYVRALGLDEAPYIRMVEDIRKEAGQVDAPAPAPVPERRHSGERRGRPERPSAGISEEWRRRAMTAGIVIIAGVMLGLGIRGVIHLIGGPRRAVMPPSPFESVEKGGDSKAAATSAATASRKRSPAAAEMGPVVVSVTAVMECWMESEVDGARPQENQMTAGDTRYFHGKEKVRLLIGNAAGVVISGPSGPLRLPTKQGKVLNILITRNSVERLRLAPAVSATNTPLTGF